MLIPVERALAISEDLRRYEELEIQIKQLTGYNIESLKVLFAKGYTLEPPKNSVLSLAGMVEDTPICGDCTHYRQVNNPYAKGSIVEYCDDYIYRPCAYYREAYKHFCSDA